MPALYNREYTCIEKPIHKDSKYAKILSKYTNLQEKLAQLVDKETFSLIDKTLECQSELSAIEIILSSLSKFIIGFIGLF